MRDRNEWRELREVHFRDVNQVGLHSFCLQRFASSDEIVDNGYQRYDHEDDANGGEEWSLPGTEDRNVFNLFDDEEE